MKNTVEFFSLKYQRYIEKVVDKKYDGRLVLMFHQVTDCNEKWYDKRYSISLKSFRDVIEWCEYNGYNFVPPKEILKADKRKKVLLTFDDTFIEVYTEVFPYLQAKDYPFIIFPSIELMKNGNYISEAVLKDIKDYEGCYIGAHTISHCMLRKQSTAKRKEEIIKPKELLEVLSGKIVECMAYPYGTYYSVGRKDKYLVKGNYAYAFSTLQTCVTEGVDRYFIPRINMNEENWKSNLERYKWQ